MGKQEISEPNPPPDASHLPDALLKLRIDLDDAKKTVLTDAELYALQKFRRAADYIAAAMIFLKDNTLLRSDGTLSLSDVKPRLLGHWGTCPGLVLVHAHLNRLIRKTGLDALYVVGPGHGAPALLACLWLEDSLAPFYPSYPRTTSGLHSLVSRFSCPGGFPSHVNAETPGAIHEGGELGYALSVAFGAVMDKPDLLAVCVVGDGEAETGPTAAAWHAAKYLDPKESGAVLPIVHVNGFKISERTVYGTMDDRELLVALFAGYGYRVRFVEDLGEIDRDLAASLEWAVGEIGKIQKAAREGRPIVKPRWPVLIMRTPKGWGGPKEFDGKIIEGSFHAHQVPLPAANKDRKQLEALQAWLRSYKTEELFTAGGAPVDEILSIIPQEKEKRLGQRAEAYKAYRPLDVPDWREFAIAKEKGEQASCMQAVGRLLRAVIETNPASFRIFSPDELESNKLDAVFEVTGRNMQWDEKSRAQGGRVIEILSEHVCQGMLQGYTLTGRTGLFPSYESFLGIVHTMMVQYAKFNKMARETKWHGDIGSLNYLETSTWARQEHNGFSHQNPSFIGAVLNLKPQWMRVYLPPDANCFLSTMSHCLRAKNYVNLMVGSKQPTPVWLSPEEADKHCIAGASVWKFASTDEGVDPDVVLVGIGVEMTFEVVAAAALLRTVAPALRVRVCNVTDLMILGPQGSHPHAMTDADFDAMFTPDRNVHFNYHGYPVELKGLLFGRSRLERVSVEGYREEGTTTSPFDVMLCNHTSRYHVAAAAIRGGARVNPKVAVDAHEGVSYVLHLAQKDRDYILKTSQDPEGTYDTPEFE
ncbi:phosphoketolase [Punctularia strigosozonata HHB-11173 SS5]|uniref:phosphoketolase n=1 Tax=Punctularia strigosozonata (strain HHB-11173) TaxID=741275 RepID=UPI0004417769|nr:phosphoketolase [Punctularia strigosozonata HHB-11173 SS5]EIN09769.1 phosphoketolase [Punctularia strigosozonata HHB-11173 SS5]